MDQDVSNRWPLINHDEVVDMRGTSPPFKSFKKSSIYFNWCTSIFDCCLCRWIIGFVLWSKGILMKIWCRGLFRGAKRWVWKLFGNEECKRDAQIIQTLHEDKENVLKREQNFYRAYNEEKQEKENALAREAKLLQAYNQEKQEKENALTRLSALAGDRLRLNNPGIADLSDEYRPNKLAEKFSELYDNEWTEFYEDLEKPGSTEKQTIGQLLNLIQEIYTVCQQQAENQRRALINVIADPSNGKSENGSPPDGILIKIIDFQKKTVPWAIEAMKKNIMKKYEDLSDNKSESKRKYIERCVQLCWMMSIQDPPMHLDFGPEKDSVIDKNVYKLFTKTGDALDFMVWPAVFLHHNGPLVQKGVLQPK
uniref:Uncharacterized protein LOC111125994 isoform X4 n=1 Tax=Crassostrea virginica TaxID=6565 RepID=A0A8B8DD56_CRAVI|nr:uncharacterized protein LOC111125994 isoform X4 [Crassostrea virginica]